MRKRKGNNDLFEGSNFIVVQAGEGKREDVCGLDRSIYVIGAIDESLAKEVNEKLLEFQKSDPLKEITMILDSYGGDIDSMFSITDMMEIIMPPIRTICIGKAMSAAAVMFLYGTKGRRFMTRHSRLMLHQISSFSSGTLSDIVIDTEEIKFLQGQLICEIEKRCSLSAKDIAALIDRDRYLRPEEAIGMGMCDGIIERLS